MRLKTGIAVAGTLVALLSALWLFCLPARLFDGVPCSTVVTAADGELLGARVASDGQWRFGPCDSVPRKFARAVVEYEDRTFYSHPGVSLRGLARALWQNISNGRVVSGGSTISMQTIRLHRRGRRNLWEKLVEVFMATRLEARCSKDEILRMYASNAPFGGNVVGIDAALWRYLGHDGASLSWAEAATLAVLQNAPSAISPSKNRHLLLAKRNRLLKRLYEKGEMDADEYCLAVEEPLIGAPYPMPRVAPHLVDGAAGGCRTRTAIDFHLQERLERLTGSWRDELALSGADDLAAVVVDVHSGQTIAYCGNASPGVEREGRWVDIARAPRSSGSILKPLLYCAALQEGLILENTLLPDIPTDFGGFVPRNFDGSFEGMVPARKALVHSLNVPNVWLLRQYGVARFASLLKRCGLTTLTRSADSYGLSLVLGGAEVTLADVVGCYAALARNDSSMPLRDSLAIYTMFDAMSEVERPDGLDGSRSESVRKVAWKTGTSYGSRDAWAIGVTPDYAVGVWVGNADGRRVADLTGARAAGPVMFDIFDLLPPTGWFSRPAAQMRRVCRHSGRPAGRYCIDTELQPVGNGAEKSGVCPYCKEVPVSADGLRLVTDASEPFEMRSFFILPPVHRHYYVRTHADYTEPPTATTDARPAFIYPADGAMVALTNGPDGNPMPLICKATHSDADEELFWHLDGNFVGSTTDIHSRSLLPAKGFHRLTIVDSKANATSVTFTIY